jgi:hypothetical protein
MTFYVFPGPAGWVAGRWKFAVLLVTLASLLLSCCLAITLALL